MRPAEKRHRSACSSSTVGLDQAADTLKRVTPKLIPAMGGLSFCRVLKRIHVQRALYEVVDVLATSELEQRQNPIRLHRNSEYSCGLALSIIVRPEPVAPTKPSSFPTPSPYIINTLPEIPSLPALHWKR